MKKIFWAIAILLSSSHALWADDLANEFFLGAHDQNYSGPVDPRGAYDLSTLQSTSLDQNFYDTFESEIISPTLFELDTFLQDEMMPQRFCPNSVMSENISYIRYIYRLMAISYLNESLRELVISKHQMNVKAPHCTLNWDRTFGKCRPQSKEMRKFLQRFKSHHLIGFEKERMVRLNKSKIEQQIKTFNQHVESGELHSIVERRLQYIAPHHKYTIESFARALDDACAIELSEINKLCSEVDAYYGFSDIALFTHLLKQSNTTAVINRGGHADGCLNRYTDLFAPREDKIPYLVDISELIFDKMTKSKFRYSQGSIFITGALREFDDKGLEDFIFTKKEEIKKAPKALPKPVVIALAPEPEPVPVPVVVPKPKEVTKQIVVEEKPAVRVSQFEQAYRRLKDDPKLELAKMDMSEFRDDFHFSPAVIEAIKEPIKEFQMRRGLQDMVIGDKLGSKSEPVQLMFLKFLIDNKMHTGLFNVIAILGERFYVCNDIDGKDEPVLVELRNDETTGFTWQISLLQFPRKKSQGELLKEKIL